MQSVSPVFTDEEVQFEKEIAKNQEEYLTVIGLPVSLELIDRATGKSRFVDNWGIALRFRFNDEDRQRIANGADLVITQLVFGKPLTPINLQLCEPKMKPVFGAVPDVQSSDAKPAAEEQQPHLELVRGKDAGDSVQ
jgi:hypothetical protein